MRSLISFLVPTNRLPLILVAASMVVATATVDWITRPYLSLGFLYLFPIIILSGILSRSQVVGLALICAVLSESFSNLPESEAILRLLLSSLGFSGTGLFVSELLRNRRTVQKHVEELEKEVTLRRDAEQNLQVLLESSPAAIVAINASGEISLANQAAQQLFSPNGLALAGQSISAYLPSLRTVLQAQPMRTFRTTLQCKGLRSTGEAFLAAVWFSTYGTASDSRLAAVVVDLSEDLRSREDLSFEHLLKTSRILVSAVTHEIRNLCGAAAVLQKNLSRVHELSGNEDFKAMTSLIQGLERMSSLSLKDSISEVTNSVELSSVLDELRVLIEVTLAESSIRVEWETPEALPLVRADRYSLLQVFLNLVKNSERAMEAAATGTLRIAVVRQDDFVWVRFEDSGTGISNPQDLFRPFRSGMAATGLGLYLSRSLMRSFGGDLVHEPSDQGCRFVVVLPSMTRMEEPVNA